MSWLVALGALVHLHRPSWFPVAAIALDLGTSRLLHEIGSLQGHIWGQISNRGGTLERSLETYMWDLFHVTENHESVTGGACSATGTAYSRR